jgi:hypothetical protein
MDIVVSNFNMLQEILGNFRHQLTLNLFMHVRTAMHQLTTYILKYNILSLHT